MAFELRLDDLLGKPVVDANGEVAGRIDELVAEWHDDVCTITEVILGPAAFAERLRHATSLRAPWAALDLDDVERPRLRVARSALARR